MRKTITGFLRLAAKLAMVILPFLVGIVAGFVYVAAKGGFDYGSTDFYDNENK